MPTNWEAALREAGLRVTRPRLAVLDALEAEPHAEADDIVRRVEAALGQTSPQTVYGVLAALEASDLVRRIDLPGNAWRYETRVADNHHHLVCRSCGRVEDVDCVVGAAPCLTPGDTHGFTVEAADVVFSGLCPDCSPLPSDPHDQPTRKDTDD
ncbi:Fur family transcriptional regulator [Gryllotalpicola ginsengisoli]|uniref:Fur family transcriptional regulator n=1 Tax=Gryllotalpicola ginsengisoli TaxID=444608 RepID=UPI0003B3B192|nr:Fur family transcriptional regulator [Gryllotalpicola ginsengisoli]